MQHPQWDDEMKFELFRFRSELRVENIRVLAPPLGLGLLPLEPQLERSLYPQLAQLPATSAFDANAFSKTQRAPQVAYLAPTNEMPASALHRSEVQSVQHIQEHIAHGQEPQAENHLIFRLWQQFLAHCIDLAFIGLCLAMGCIVLTAMLDPSSLSFRPNILAQSVTLQFLAKQSAWIVLIAAYCLFTCYWVLFKIVSGTTLGESCLHNFSHVEEQLQAPLGKGSSDT